MDPTDRAVLWGMFIVAAFLALVIFSFPIGSHLNADSYAKMQAKEQDTLTKCVEAGKSPLDCRVMVYGSGN